LADIFNITNMSTNKYISYCFIFILVLQCISQTTQMPIESAKGTNTPVNSDHSGKESEAKKGNLHCVSRIDYESKLVCYQGKCTNVSVTRIVYDCTSLGFSLKSVPSK